MSSITSLAIDDALGNISAYYHPVLKVIMDEYLLPGERLLFAADSTRHHIATEGGVSLIKMLTYEDDIGTEKDVVVNQAALLVITNQRWIRMTLADHQYEYSVRIQRETGAIDRLLGGGNKLKYEWHLPPKEFPHEWLRKRKSSDREYIMQSIQVAALSEVSVTGRTEYALRNKHTKPESSLHLIMLSFHSDVRYSLKYDDGNTLHRLLQLASIKGGMIQPDDKYQKLRQLKAMLDDRLITDQEYQAKKEQLLAEL